jgi:ferredoxin
MALQSAVMIPSDPVRVWIEPGCTSCGWCSQLSPAVFLPGTQGSEVRADVRCDGRQSPNREERSPLRADDLGGEEVRFLHFVAAGCPVAVIRIEDPAAQRCDPVSGLRAG